MKVCRLTALLLACLFMFSPLCSFGQGASTSYGSIAHYGVATTENEKGWIEVWFAKRRPDISDSYMAYEVLKNNVREDKSIFLQTIETTTDLSTTIKKREQDTFHVLKLETHPLDLKSGESSFGHLEVRSITDENLLDDWPIFFSLISGEMLDTVTYTLYLPSGKKLITIETYSPEEYQFPYLRTVDLYGQDDKMISRSTWKRF